jgi:Ni/Co efflux regulator RcnB
MKRVLIFVMIVASMGISVIGVEAKPNTVNAAGSGAPQQIDRIIRQATRRRRHHNNNNGNVTYETRTVWKGKKEYRDTYRITWKDGKRHEKRVSHVRIR